jgi:hypothetical protein
VNRPGSHLFSYFTLYQTSLLLEVDALVLMPRDSRANLLGRLSQLRLLVGVEAFLGAGRALGPVQRFEAAPQAGVAQGTVAAAVARELVDHTAHLGHLLIHVDLPGKAEILAGQLVSRHNRGQRGEFQRSRRMVGRHVNVIGGVGELGVAGHRGRGSDQSQNQPALDQVLHAKLSQRKKAFPEAPSASWIGLDCTKKDGTNVLLFVPGGQ